MNDGLTVYCPKCGANIGERCHSITRGHEPYPIKSHKERITLAMELRRKAQ